VQDTVSLERVAMIGEGVLSLREFVMREPLPLATIQDAVLEFLKGRDDAVVFGAQAVNAYVDEYRMSQDVDILSHRAEQLAEELRSHLTERFHIAIRSREVGEGRGFRLFQVRKPKNRHLVDVRSVEELPAAQRVGDLLILMPPELVAGKVVAYCRRRGRPKAGTDWRDLAMLLLKFPELKSDPGPITDRLKALADPEVLTVWREIVSLEIVPEEEDEEFQ
jgi:hypothetical protein